MGSNREGCFLESSTHTLEEGIAHDYALKEW